MDGILLDIVCILPKFMNFQMVKMYGNNDMYYEDMKI